MRLFIAREMLDPHLKIGAPILNSGLLLSERFKSAIQATGFYAKWYPKQWLSPSAAGSAAGFHPVLSRHIRFAADASHRLAREIFHAMARYGPKLEREQVLLGRFVDIGAEIFAIASSCARAQSALSGHETVKTDLLALADYFSRTAHLRIEWLFHSAKHNVDRRGYKWHNEFLAANWIGLRQVSSDCLRREIRSLCIRLSSWVSNREGLIVQCVLRAFHTSSHGH